MSETIDNGGPAFPCPATDAHPGQGGMSLRDWFAGNVSFEEADSIIGKTAGDVATFLGITSKEYRAIIHFPQAIAKAKFIFADAMIAESKKDRT